MQCSHANREKLRLPCNPELASKRSRESGLLFAEQSGRNIAHISLLKLVVSAAVLIDSDIFECRNHRGNVEAHCNEAVNQILIVSVIPSPNMLTG